MKALHIKIWDVTLAQLTGNVIALNVVFEKEERLIQRAYVQCQMLIKGQQNKSRVSRRKEIIKIIKVNINEIENKTIHD